MKFFCFVITLLVVALGTFRCSRVSDSRPSRDGATSETAIEVARRGDADELAAVRRASRPAEADLLVRVHVAFQSGVTPDMPLQRRIFESADFHDITGRFGARAGVTMKQMQYSDAASVWAYEFEVRGARRDSLARDLAGALKQDPDACATFVDRTWDSITISELKSCTASRGPA